MRKIMFILLAFLSAYCLHAEEPLPSVMDSVLLEEIVTYGDYVKYQPGAKITTLTSEQIESANDAGLDQLLSRYTPIYIKSNAGGLSTIRIRGTAPDHTSINFGGININSLTLGHSNMSTIPTFLFDRLELQYGGSSALNGSGAIGGAIYLGQQNQWTKGVKANFKYTRGSFGENFYGSKIYLGNGKFESVTRLYFYENENNFTFKNKYTGDVVNREPIIDIQHGASIKNKGLLQEFNYLFSPNEYIKSSVWIDNSWHQVQPNMQSNIQFKNTEEIKDENIRIWACYKNGNKPLKFNLGAGYVHDYQLYNKNETQEIITNRFIADASVKRNLNKTSEAKLGAKYKYIIPEVYSYAIENIDYEQHLDLYFSYFYQPIKRLKTTLNLRQMFVSNFNAPFTPSFGAEYQLISSNDQRITATTNIAKSYRIPTLNDRFWGNQGNPNLKPEDGFNLEGGLKYYFSNGVNHQTLNLNGFYMDIDNWIEWRNYGVWQAQNVQRVISKGIEFQSISHIENGMLISEIRLNYTLNSAQATESYGNGITNHQLIYTPIHMGNISYSANYKSYSANINGLFTGPRVSNYLGSKLPPYFLTNVGINYKFKLQDQNILLAFHANNIFNAQYQNEKYYAMPGRNFRLSFTCLLNKIKS